MLKVDENGSGIGGCGVVVVVGISASGMNVILAQTILISVFPILLVVVFSILWFSKRVPASC